MKLSSDQLLARLRQPGNEALAPIYLISGDEPFQLGELADALRSCARRQGYTDRQVFFAERGFDWQSLSAEQDALSLFAERRVLDLRLPGSKPGDAGSRALRAYAARPPADTVLLVTTGKLDRSQARSKWVTELERAGVAAQVWPVEAGRLPRWLQSRMQARGLDPDTGAVQLLAERVEGNLLAADQAMEKLLLLYGPGPVDTGQVIAAAADSARFDVFSLGDTALSGDTPRALRMLFGLLAEGVEPAVALWALARVTREASRLAAAGQTGAALDGAMTRLGIWDKRKPAVRAALQRHSQEHWHRLVRCLARADRVIKGLEAGTVRDELIQLVTGIAAQGAQEWVRH